VHAIWCMKQWGAGRVLGDEEKSQIPKMPLSIVTKMDINPGGIPPNLPENRAGTTLRREAVFKLKGWKFVYKVSVFAFFRKKRVIRGAQECIC